MPRRLDPETGVNKPFENVLYQGAYSEFLFFQGGGAPNFVTFLSVVCFGKVNFKLFKYQKRLWGGGGGGGSGGMLSRKIFENLHTIMAILELFE